MILLPSGMPPAPKIVYLVRQWPDGTSAVILDPDTWKQGTETAHTSSLYPFTEKGWLECCHVAIAYTDLKVRYQKELPKILKRLAKP